MDGMSSTPGGGEVLTVKIAGERFSLAVSEVTEIIRPRDITRVPLAPTSLIGVTNLRGAILPVISLVGLLGSNAARVQATSRVVVIDGRMSVGLLVDEVSALAQTSDAKPIDLEALLAHDFAGRPRRLGKQETKPSSGNGLKNAAGTPAVRRQALALVAFTLANQEYALPLDQVAEVIALAADIAQVPRTDHAMLGVVAFRGGLLPLVSLRALLGLPTEGSDDRRARVIVTHVGETLVGLLADGMNAIVRADDDVIDPVPPVLTRGTGGSQIEAICRLDQGRRLLSILSPGKLFDAATAARIQDDAQEGAPQMSSSTTQTGRTEQFVVFSLGREQYGLPIGAVDEIVRCPDTLTRVPGAPAFVEGVMSLRGKVVPVIDLRQRFESGGSGGRNRRIVIMTIDGVQTGFVVDSISEILSARADELTAAPELTTDGVQIFDRVARMQRNGRVILLIAPRGLLDQAARDMLAAIATQGEVAPLS